MRVALTDGRHAFSQHCAPQNQLSHLFKESSESVLCWVISHDLFPLLSYWEGHETQETLDLSIRWKARSNSMLHVLSALEEEMA